jgi:hypothetical protein
MLLILCYLNVNLIPGGTLRLHHHLDTPPFLPEKENKKTLNPSRGEGRDFAVPP